MKKAFQTGTESYKDIITGREGDWLGAKNIYDIAGRSYEAAGDIYALDERQADYDYRKQLGLLEEGVTGQWETDWSGFWNTLPPTNV